MHSGELAKLAGVTVRTLRHYHQIGILDEPERSHNGYRSYDVHDLIRVLRIKRLASLGIALEKMPELLDDAAESSEELLNELDGELAAQVDRLVAQREMIAHLRQHNASPDLPPELAPFLAAFAAAGVSPKLAKFDREQSVLLAHIVGVEGMPQLTRYYERLTEPENIDVATAIAQRFDHLGDHSTEQEIDELVERFVAGFQPLIEEFAVAEISVNPAISAQVFARYEEDLLNDQQREVLARLSAQLG